MTEEGRAGFWNGLLGSQLAGLAENSYSKETVQPGALGEVSRDPQSRRGTRGLKPWGWPHGETSLGLAKVTEVRNSKTWWEVEKENLVRNP